MIRRVETPSDYARCARICNAVEPQQPVTAEQLAARHDGSLLLHEGGGYAFVARSSYPGSAFAMVRVLPEARRRGVGSALLGAAAAEARTLDADSMWGRVREDDGTSLGFVRRRGFADVAGEVAFERDLAENEGELPAGIVELREEHLRGAHAVAVECTPEMATDRAAEAGPFDEWVESELRGAITFVALDGGDVVGYATLFRLPATPDRLEHGLTAVLRGHRRRGVGTALKRAQIAWAAAHGYRRLVTSTDEANAAMRAVNDRLGYRRVPGSILVRGPSR